MSDRGWHALQERQHCWALYGRLADAWSRRRFIGWKTCNVCQILLDASACNSVRDAAQIGQMLSAPHPPQSLASCSLRRGAHTANHTTIDYMGNAVQQSRRGAGGALKMEQKAVRWRQPGRRSEAWPRREGWKKVHSGPWSHPALVQGCVLYAGSST